MLAWVEKIQVFSISFLMFAAVLLGTVYFGYPIGSLWFWVVSALALVSMWSPSRRGTSIFSAVTLALVLGMSNWFGARDFVGLGLAEIVKLVSADAKIPVYSEMLEVVETEAAEAQGVLSDKIISEMLIANEGNLLNYPLDYPIFWGDDNFPRFVIARSDQGWDVNPIEWMSSKATLLDWSAGRVVFFNRGEPAIFTATVSPKFELHGAVKEYPVKNLVHHWGSVWREMVYVSGVSSRPVSELRALFPESVVSGCEDGAFRGEVVEIVNLTTGDSQVFPLTEIMASVEEVHFRPEHVMSCDDPLHLNDVIIITDKLDAEQFGGAKPGDFLVSLRANNMLMLVSRETQKVLWHSIGVGSGQHSPKLRGKYLFSFDNSGSAASNGMTQIDSIDVVTGQVYSYQASGRDVLYARSRGRIQLTDADPQSIYVQEQRAGAKNRKLSRTRWPETGGRLIRVTCDGINVFSNCSQKTIFDFGRGGTNYTILDDPHFLKVSP